MAGAQYVGVAAAPRRAGSRPCRPRVLVVLASGWPRIARRSGARHHAHAGRSVRGDFREVFRAGAGAAGDDRCGAGRGRLPIGGAAPLLVLSGLAVIVVAGDSIELHHQRILGYRLGRPAAGAGDLRAGGDRPVAVDHRHRADGWRSRRPPWAASSPKFRAPDRASARRSSAATAHRRTGGARRAEPPQRLFRRRSAHSPWVTAARHPRKGRGGRLAGARHQSGAAARDQGAISRSRSRGAAAHSSGRCAAGCRPC